MAKFVSIKDAARILKKGGIVAYPTETFYGLAARADDPSAVSRIFEIKGRERGKPISILISSSHELGKWALNIGPRERKLIRRFWPGPLTLVCRAKKGVDRFLTGGSGKIGVRISSNRLALKLTRLSGGAITATSANYSGQSPAMTGASVRRLLGDKIDGVIAGGRLKKSKGSTILDVSSNEMKVIREGQISRKRIELS
ncbi:MAG: threonylcarbamoyl-AMP synthase [Deltaproteobacteria bacterium]|nr:threonylcarbamoyl-AMP synthase [Deltaproteobacteria bacterium]